MSPVQQSNDEAQMPNRSEQLPPLDVVPEVPLVPEVPDASSRRERSPLFRTTSFAKPTSSSPSSSRQPTPRAESSAIPLASAFVFVFFVLRSLPALSTRTRILNALSVPSLLEREANDTRRSYT